MYDHPQLCSKSLIFLCCTHGYELVGKKVFDTYPAGLSEWYQYRSIIGNPEAMYLNTRYIETDLNRSYPGNPKGTYEERRAHQLLPMLQEADLVLDIHQTASTTPDFMVVQEWTPQMEDLDQYTHITNTLVLNEGSGSFNGTLMASVPHSAALEYGNLFDISGSWERVQSDIESILHKKPTGIKSKHFAICGELSLEFKGQAEIDNFVRLTDEQRELFGINEKNIYPTFIGGYPDKWAVLLREI